MKAIRIALSIMTLGSLMSFSAFAESGLPFQITDGNVGFLAIGKPSAIKIRGKGTAPKGAILVAGKDIQGEFTFDENSLDTGINLRDRHMKEKYLQTEKYPTAKFKITKLTLPAEFAATGFKAENIPVEGDLTLHGITKPVKGTATIACNSGVATGHIAFGTQITEYGIEIPSYMGVKVADHVDVDVDLQAKANKK